MIICNTKVHVYIIHTSQYKSTLSHLGVVLSIVYMEVLQGLYGAMRHGKCNLNDLYNRASRMKKGNDGYGKIYGHMDPEHN